MASGTTQGPLPWSWYSDSELRRREQGLIFRRGLQYAGPAEHAAGPVAPAGPERTRGFLDSFFPEAVPDAEVEELLAFDDQVGLEDRALVESVQAGRALRAARRGGRLMPESERLRARFQHLVREALP